HDVVQGVRVAARALRGAGGAGREDDLPAGAGGRGRRGGGRRPQERRQVVGGAGAIGGVGHQPRQVGAWAVTASENSSSWTSRVLPSRAITSASCGPAKPVFMYRIVAPSFSSATVASTNHRLLRHSSATGVCTVTPR